MDYFLAVVGLVSFLLVMFLIVYGILWLIDFLSAGKQYMTLSYHLNFDDVGPPTTDRYFWFKSNAFRDADRMNAQRFTRGHEWRVYDKTRTYRIER